jgi:acyl-CoA-binding protein
MSDPYLQDEFEKAAAFLPGVVGKLDSADLLYFYGRFKQAKVGPNDTAKPGFFEFQGKQKWQAWKDMGDMSKETAMSEYVDKMNQIDPDWVNKECPEGGGIGWVSVSAMIAPEEENIPDDKKSIFDWTKEGNVSEVETRLRAGDASLKCSTDEDGMGLIHWAADRGDAAMTVMLLRLGVDVNQTDGDGQTALHFASSCGHGDVARMLIESKVDVGMCDSEGTTAEKMACDQDMKQLLQRR